jgi:GTP-binding protein
MNNYVIKSVSFVKSSTKISECPKPQLNEFAFIGRSNVGKSSLINMLMQRTKLAKISSTPGKTRTINHFIVNDEWYLVDLPGYGYAKRSKTERETFSGMIKQYILKHPTLLLLFVLIDFRLPPQKADMEFIDFLGMNHIPFHIVFTKQDKVNVSDREQKLKLYLDYLSESWETLPEYYISSSKTGLSREEILQTISRLNNKFSSKKK